MNRIKYNLWKRYRNIPFLRFIVRSTYLTILYANPFRYLRQKRYFTEIFGPMHRRSKRFIEIDLTYQCNLGCDNCDRACKTAPSKDRLSIYQIKRFIKESVDNGLMWKRIRILGGEPTLHPDINRILNLLIEYKRSHSKKTVIELVSNGFGGEVRRTLSEIPKDIIIDNTAKRTDSQLFIPFNIAPIDSRKYDDADFTNGCRNISECGIGLTPYGYYPCAAAGTIDRVFGFDKGKKELPKADDQMLDQLNIFCRYCGHFRITFLTKKVKISPTWKKAYDEYKIKKPELTYY